MTELDKTFDTLKSILGAYAKQLDQVTDKPGNYYVNTKKADDKNKPVFFGMVKSAKNKVAYHLMPVYCHPELLDDISDDLRKRMQGKSCFNFTADTATPELIKELKRLTKAGVLAYQAKDKM